MREHRLIERFVNVIKNELSKIVDQNDVDSGFIVMAVDFFRTYADSCHHGKEEDILFKELESKKLAEKDQKIMEELIQEHVYARKTVTKLEETGNKYSKGDQGTLKQTISILNELCRFYPSHIEKEDKHFFYPCMDYFTKPELDKMLEQFWEFDRKMIHQVYEKIVSNKEKSKTKNESIQKQSEKWECTVCGYIYNPINGDPEHGITPGTNFEDLPENWVCPICFSPKDVFKKI
jgi:hemerythrin-like domain-containing protein/rubredoxin